MKTNSLRKLVASRLKTICSRVYFKRASKDAMYPHIVYSFKTVNLNDIQRDDVMLEIDIWHRRTDSGAEIAEIEDLADLVETLFNCQNLPQEDILPTFYRSSRTEVEDEDKDIEHRVLQIQIQNYER